MRWVSVHYHLRVSLDLAVTAAVAQSRDGPVCSLWSAKPEEGKKGRAKNDSWVPLAVASPTTGAAGGKLVKITRRRSEEVETKPRLVVEAGIQMATLLDQHRRHENRKEKLSQK